MNQTVHDALRAEAMERMKLLGLPIKVIRQFEQTGEVCTCACITGRPLTSSDETKSLIPKLEQQHGILIYLNVHTEAAFGSIDNLFFVGEYKEEWEWEREEIKDNYALVYAYNWSRPECSEMGTIGFERTRNGGIIRTC